MANSKIRQAALADIPQMADVFAAGFIDDDVFGRFMHPKRREYPQDWLRYWTWDLRKHFADPAALCFVHLDEAETVKGCCMMRRMGKGGDTIAATESWSHKAERYLGSLWTRWDDLTFTDRSADKRNMEIFDKNWDDIKHHWEGPREESWLIEMLCIHPDAQKAGYGRGLIQNAIQVCKSEDPAVPLSVIASEIGDAFYEKQGFRQVGWASVGDMSDVRGGSIKFYEKHLQS